MDDLLTFDQAYNAAKNILDAKGNSKNISILLGNGFSMGYDPRRFSFTNLLESAKQNNIIPANSNLLRIFKSLETADFERVIKVLEDGKLVAQIYGAPFNIENVECDIVALKNHLVDTIMNNHPDKSVDIPKVKSEKCAEFLEKFDKIYSLNYDLLAYWVILQNNLGKFTDGFGESEYEDDADYVVHKDSYQVSNKLLFLHGGLHIFDNKTEIKKLTFCRPNEPLKNQIMRNLSKNVYPVFVSEGTSEAKLEKIMHNSYLNSCRKSLGTQGGTLFMLGTALKSNDEHIRKTIINGVFDSLFIGIWSEQDLHDANCLKDEFEASWTGSKQRHAYLYNARTVNPWG